MTIIATLHSLFQTATRQAETPALNWQAPPPMTDDALHGGRARTVRGVACLTPTFLPARGSQS